MRGGRGYGAGSGEPVRVRLTSTFKILPTLERGRSLQTCTAFGVLTEVAIVVEVADVARVVPPVRRGLGGRPRIPVVTGRHQRGADDDLAAFPGVQQPPAGLHDRDGHQRRRPAAYSVFDGLFENCLMRHIAGDGTAADRLRAEAGWLLTRLMA